MSSALPRPLLAIRYEEAAQAYLRALPLEHFMEATAQATQRKITLESLDLVTQRRPDVHVFNELLVQAPRPRGRQLVQVVPDNMVVLSDQPIRAQSSFNLPLEPAGPFWVMEYVSNTNKRKDYEDSFQKYERDLKVPYYLIFYPDNQELTLYHHTGKKYVSVRPNKHGRCPIPELDLEVGLHAGFVRYWYQGELLPLPADLQRSIDQLKERLARETRRAEEEKRRADELKQRLEAAEEELARLRARPNGSRRRDSGPSSGGSTPEA
jgi:Uma2 family endonuclease